MNQCGEGRDLIVRSKASMDSELGRSIGTKIERDRTDPNSPLPLSGSLEHYYDRIEPRSLGSIWEWIGIIWNG